MLVKHISKSLVFFQPFRYRFASAAASVDYYKLLGISPNATFDQIQAAFAKVTKKVNPNSDSKAFNKLSQAFVILSDSQARDAYDSLLRSYNVTYINQRTIKQPATQSYLAERKAKKAQQVKKAYRIDDFGRYKGGIPERKGKTRKNALGEPGTVYTPMDYENMVDDFPEYSTVDSYKAESFKNFHQDEREQRTMKRPWRTVSVDYNFFGFRTLWQDWPIIRALLMIYLVSYLWTHFMMYRKKWGSRRLQKLAEQRQE